MKKKLSIAIIMFLLLLVGCSTNQVKKEVGVITLDNSVKTGISDAERVKNNGAPAEIVENVEKSGGYMHYDSLTTALLGLDKGDIKILIIPGPTADYIVKQNPGKYEWGADKNYAVLVMGAMKEKQELIDEINSALDKIISSRKLDMLYKKYILMNNTDGDVQIHSFEGAKTIKVAVTGDIPPFDYVDPAGKAAGFNVALLSAIGDEMKVNIELVNVDAGSRAIAVATGKADAVFWMCGNSKNDKGNTVDFSSDVPEGMITSTKYAIVPYAVLSLSDSNQNQ